MTAPAPSPTRHNALAHSIGARPRNSNARQARPIEPHHRRGFPVTSVSKSRAAAALTRGSRRIFADMLWRAFPFGSEGAISERAGPVLGLTPRQVRRLLRGECDAKAKHFLAVAAIIGVEAALTAIYGDG